ncbi:zinc finger and BTB domain-containing protein 8A.1-A [Procambarus clarkii]|uniref:zinc finger and BTB domain-containing protein 8A.1-A n=1 Tax=Procambarus clarkii TaxID=6728 RepID=UPI001E673DF3|nr:uncharacterized protein LOC123758521 [Procambarus clarkii]
MSETRSGSGPTRPPPPLCPLLPEDEDYDAWVLAGGRLFRAHTSVLSSHSVYLRGAAAGSSSTSTSDRDVRLLLPHVPPAGFAAILTYMYTGRLPLTPSTLYEVLLAGHLLQMAGVVSLCQALLSTTTSAATTGTSLGLCEVPPALSVWRGLARLVPPHQHATSTNSSLPATIVRPTPTRPRLQHHPLNHSQGLVRDSEALEETTGAPVGDERSLPQHTDENTAPESIPHYRHKVSVDDSGRVNAGAVVIDVAACDGPVFFERVINRSYRANPLLGHDDSETETEINVDDIDSCDDAIGQPHLRDLPESSGNTERDGLSNLLRLQAVRETQQNALAASPPMPSNHISRTYHCVYCNHTFKSHYCYQKHMRRHINPITVEVDKMRGTSIEVDKPRGSGVSSSGVTDGPQDGGSHSEGQERAGESNSNSGANGVIANGSIKSGSVSPNSSRNLSPAPSEGLKILDLNVQYFPCKTCGSKFPSYYFVHKHRRLCHQDEESATFTKKTANQTPSTSTSSTPTPTPVNTPASTPANTPITTTTVA